MLFLVDVSYVPRVSGDCFIIPWLTFFNFSVPRYIFGLSLGGCFHNPYVEVSAVPKWMLLRSLDVDVFDFLS